MRAYSPPSGGCGGAGNGTAAPFPSSASNSDWESWEARAPGPDLLGDLALRGFGFTDDPFRVEHTLGRPSLLTRQTALTLADLEKQARLAAESRSNLLLVGPEGSGKTLLLKSIARILVQNGGVCSVTYFDAGTGESNAPREGVRAGRLPPPYGSKATAAKPNTLLLIDNADRMFEGAQMSYDAFLKERMISALVLSVSYPTYLSICEDDSLAQRFRSHFVVRTQEQQEIERMLREAIASCVVSGEPFEPGAFQMIAARSMGLPGLAVDLAKSSLLVADWVGLSQVTNVIVDRTAKHLSFATANGLISGQVSLRGARYRIAHEVLKEHYAEGRSRRSSLYLALSDLAGSTIDYHTQKLAAEGIITIGKRTHRVSYEMPRPVRAALQIMLAKGAQSFGQAESKLRLPMPHGGIRYPRGRARASYLEASGIQNLRRADKESTSNH